MKFINGMANISIKSAKLTPFGGIFSIMEQSDSKLSSVIGSTLGIRSSTFGYQYSEIIRSLMSVYFCGGSCIEDVTTHLMSHLSLHPTLRTCSADTILLRDCGLHLCCMKVQNSERYYAVYHLSFFNYITFFCGLVSMRRCLMKALSI